MVRVLAAILVATLSTCGTFPRAGGVFTVLGDLANYSNQDCEMLVTKGTQPMSLVMGNYSVGGTFEQRVIVSPFPDDYRIRIHCNGNLVHERVFNFRMTPGLRNNVVLGVIV